jgi:hypothetical protein
MFRFRRSAKQSNRDSSQGAAGENKRDFVSEIASQAEAIQLRDTDPVYSFTATEVLRFRDPKYVPLWPSDGPRRRR